MPMTYAEILHEERLHKVIKDQAVAAIHHMNEDMDPAIALAFCEGYLLNISYADLQKVFAMTLVDAFFTIYSKHGPA